MLARFRGLFSCGPSDFPYALITSSSDHPRLLAFASSEVSLMDSQAIITAGTRFRRAWDTGLKPGGHSIPFAGINVLEFHEAALDLMRATEAATLQAAFKVLFDVG